MPALSKAKHEIAAQALASGKSQADAYRAGGYLYKPANASRLCRSAAIETRVEEILRERATKETAARNIGIQRAGLSEEWIITRLKYVIDLSIRGVPTYDRKGNPLGVLKSDLDAAIDGLKTAARIAGLMVQKHEIGGSGAFARMTDDELERAAVAHSRSIGLSETTIDEIRQTFGK